MKVNSFVLALMLSMPVLPAGVYADGSDYGAGVVPGVAKEPDSPQLRDKRLPPVMPGQEVQSNGKKMNVWSTSGPVEVAQPPEPWRKGDQNLQVNEQGIGIIVDERRPQRPQRDTGR